MKSRRKVMFFLCGRSGSGKDSMLKKVLEMNPDLQLNLPVTNRAMREGEQEGVEYRFVTTDEFMNIAHHHNRKLFCYKVYHTYDAEGNPFDAYYGYPKPVHPFTILPGPWDVFMDIYLMRQDPQLFRLVPIYITVENEWELLYRAINREMKNDPPRMKEVARRFCADQRVYPSNEIARNYLGDQSIIINSDYDQALSQMDTLIKNIIEEEKANGNMH